MDRPQWPQETVVKPMEILAPNTGVSSNSNNNSNNNLSKPSSSTSSFERRARPQKATPVNCPRCDSTNTKFCYYNNYSLSQPRYFCKSCRRYWTEGGTLRNIPVGGGSRKNKRSSTTSSSSTSSYSSVTKSTLPDLIVPSVSQNPKIHHDQYGQDLNLGFPSTNNFKNVPELLQVPNFDATRNTANTASALELLTRITSRGTTSSFMPIPIPSPSMMIPMAEFKIPSLSFSLDGMESNNGGRLLFPFEELKTNTSATQDDDPSHVGQNKDQNCDSNGFWNGMMGGGSCLITQMDGLCDHESWDYDKAFTLKKYESKMK